MRVCRPLLPKDNTASTPQVVVGTEDWLVKCRPKSAMQEQLEKLQTTVDTLKDTLKVDVEGYRESTSILARPYLQIVAAEALLLAAHSKKDAKASHKFKKLAQQEDGKLEKFTAVVSKHVGVRTTASSYAVTADSILHQRNHQACHYVSWEELDAEVEHARQLVKTMPSLRTECRFEAMLLELYKDLKECFP